MKTFGSLRNKNKTYSGEWTAIDIASFGLLF